MISAIELKELETKAGDLSLYATLDNMQEVEIIGLCAQDETCFIKIRGGSHPCEVSIERLSPIKNLYRFTADDMTEALHAFRNYNGLDFSNDIAEYIHELLKQRT